MSLNLYYFPLSQPSRAVHALLLLGNVQFTPHVVDVLKKENETPEFAKINPSQGVPAIVDGDFHLFESHAILRYIVAKYKLDKYYPQDPQQAALVESYLDWHHGNTRITTAYLFDFFIKPNLQKVPAPENKEERLKYLTETVAFFEKVFLGDGHFQFIFNQPSVTIADLSAFFELTGLLNINFDFEHHHTLKKYFQTMFTIPEVKKAHEAYNAFMLPHKAELNPFIQSLLF